MTGDFKVEKVNPFKMVWDALVWILPFKKEPFRRDNKCKPAKKE